mmetsp:Transcript_36054/g.74968  ORF Transcript_36054/g.74968 Transcript_36054/m.74968 type:complete len:297 (+) Transcript_36054:59-949(+)
MASSNGADANLMELISMGFDPGQCQSALDRTRGNLEQAVHFLLTGEAPRISIAPSSAPPKMVHGPISQYSMENGRSACTCIALKSASDVLSQFAASVAAGNDDQEEQDQQEAAQEITLESFFTPKFLQMSIVLGIETYNNLKVMDSAMEHKSAEEVLATGCFPSLSQDGPVMQGMLSNSPYTEHEPLGLFALLQASQDQDLWTCVLLTKPPETVLVILPPISLESTALNFVLIDSHPRPQQFQAEQSYARIHAQMADLVTSLNAIFPCTELGADIPPLMAAMYNQFDLYRFRRNKE